MPPYFAQFLPVRPIGHPKCLSPSVQSTSTPQSLPVSGCPRKKLLAQVLFWCKKGEIQAKLPGGASSELRGSDTQVGPSITNYLPNRPQIAEEVELLLIAEGLQELEATVWSHGSGRVGGTSHRVGRLLVYNGHFKERKMAWKLAR